MNFELPPTGTEKSPAFVTAESCQEWLTKVPMANAVQAQAMLLQQLHLLHRFTLPPTDRFTILETLRHSVSRALRNTACPGAGRKPALRCAVAQIGAGKWLSSRQRGITCQCRCGTRLPRLARLILSGCMILRSARSVANTTSMKWRASPSASWLISATCRFQTTRQTPGNDSAVESTTRTTRHDASPQSRSPPGAVHNSQSMSFATREA